MIARRPKPDRFECVGTAVFGLACGCRQAVLLVASFAFQTRLFLAASGG